VYLAYHHRSANYQANGYGKLQTHQAFSQPNGTACSFHIIAFQNLDRVKRGKIKCRIETGNEANGNSQTRK
jgi:hypothetical protein